METAIHPHDNPKLIHFNIGAGSYKTCICPCKECITPTNQCFCHECGCWDDSEPPRNHPRGITRDVPKPKPAFTLVTTTSTEHICNVGGCGKPVLRTSERGRWPLKCPLHKK